MPYKDKAIRNKKQKEYSLRYQLKYPNRVKAKKATWHANKKAKTLNLAGRLTRKDIEELLDMNPSCLICGSTSNLSIDHIKPFKKGGLNTIQNIQVICWLCNMKKTYKDDIHSWSAKHDCCKYCNTTDRKHEAKGLCTRCYDRSKKGWTKRKIVNTPKMQNRWW